MRSGVRALALVVSAAIVVACASHKLEPPDGLTAQNGGGEAGQSMGSSAESGAGQFGGGDQVAFAATAFEVPEVSLVGALWQEASQNGAVLYATAVATTSGAATPTPSPAPSVTPPASPTPTPSACTVSLTSIVDADQDTFPDTMLTADFAACLIGSGSSSVAATGTLTIVDTSATNPSFGFQRVVDVGVTQGTMSGSVQSTATGSQADATHFVIDQNSTIHLSDSTTTVDQNSNWTLTYVPASGAWGPPWTPAAGTLEVAGAWSYTRNGLTANAAITTTTPLTVDPGACATRVTAGALQGVFTSPKGTNHTIAVTWTACGAKTVTFDGQVVP